MGCIFPDANNPQEYWDNIIKKHSAIGQIPKDRWDPKVYYDPDRKDKFKSYSKICAPVTGFKKDGLKFRIPPVSEPYIERTQFMILEAVYQAFQDAGYLDKDFPRQKTAVYIGSNGKGEMGPLYNTQANWPRFIDALSKSKAFKQTVNLKQRQKILVQAEELFRQGLPQLSEDTCGGIFGSIVASRINSCFNLQGTSLVVDAACASSLAAVEAGIQGLRSGKFDLIVAGGVDARLDISSFLFFSSLGALSDTGCYPFDQRADGLVLGEGAGSLLLKRLEDAIKNKDKIYAVIRNVSSASDGRAKGITAPDVNGQIRALERTYHNLPFSPADINLIEAHGTGTWIGDQVELESLNRFFSRFSNKKKHIGIGSVKSMIGHLKSASGIAGIIKVVQALDKKILPPTINCEKPRKDIDWKNSPFYLINNSRKWKAENEPRRAAVDCFGFGGINYHAVLEEFTVGHKKSKALGKGFVSEQVLPKDIFVFSAKDRKTLEKNIKSILDNPKTKIMVLDAFRACNYKKDNNHKVVLALVAADRQELLSLLKKASNALRQDIRQEFFMAQGIYYSEIPMDTKHKIAFLFPGSGAHYPNMAGDLLRFFPFVEHIFKSVDRASFERTGISIIDILTNKSIKGKTSQDSFDTVLARADYNHPAMMAMEISILQMLKSAEIVPDMAAGHSLGEYFALYAAGVFDMKTVIDIITVRGQGISQSCFENGSMLSIGLNEKKTRKIISKFKDVFIANKNCPDQSVVSGKKQAIDKLANHLEKNQIICKKLPVASAYHTKLLKPCLQPFRQYLDKFKINNPKFPVQCNLTGKQYEVNRGFSKKLKDTLTEHMVKPVEFIRNIEALYKNNARVFIEIGPKSILSSFVDNILGAKDHYTIATNLPNRSASEQLLHALAFCAAKSININFKGFFNQCSSAKENIDTKQNAKDNLLLAQEIGPREKPLDQDIKNKVIKIIADKTGYPKEVIDIDQDVELELGLDSIKQVEIIKNVAKLMKIDFGTDLRAQKYKITTARKLIEQCSEMLKIKPEIDNILIRQSKDKKTRTLGSNVKTDCHRWITKQVPKTLTLQNNDNKLKNKNILIIASGKKVTGLLAKCLRDYDANVFIQGLGSKSIRFSADIDIVINMSSFKRSVQAAGNTSKWWKQLKTKAQVLFKIAQAIAKNLQADKTKEIIWVEVTGLGSDLHAKAQPMGSAKAGLGLGLIRCLVLEFETQLKHLILDFNIDHKIVELANDIAQEINAGITHNEIGYRGSRRFEIIWQKQKLRSNKKSTNLDSKSVILAIGGTRGITASLCQQIANEFHPVIIAVGKSKLKIRKSNPPSCPLEFNQVRQALIEDHIKTKRTVVPAKIDKIAWDKVWESERTWNIQLLQKKTTAEYYQCDITDIKQVKKLIKYIKRKFGKIDIVINGASGLIEKATENMSFKEFIDNLKAKALGTACLISALRKVALKAFINFSSVAGRWGNKGQSSYAAGHEVGAILVSSMRCHEKTRWQNIFFGPWLNVGMIRIGEVVQRLRQKGSDFITDQTGSEFFIKEMLSDSNQNVAFCGAKSIRTNKDRNALIDEIFIDIVINRKTKNLLNYNHKICSAGVALDKLEHILEDREIKEQVIKNSLSAFEIKKYYSFKNKKKKKEWLAGRLAAKKATSDYFKRHNPRSIDICISNLNNGAPKIELEDARLKDKIPHLSISHSGGIAAAIVSEKPGIAIDVQAITPSIFEIADAFSSINERKLISKLKGINPLECLTGLWAAKEAGRKAAGVGLCTMKQLKMLKIVKKKDDIKLILYHKNTGNISAVVYFKDEHAQAISRLSK
jgi:acyl transferase domain-containing protein/NAD(P)-dependent dehydrogenase (short-subunit alcohol dehydrogenase family)/phosphopantetheinyl transferase